LAWHNRQCLSGLYEGEYVLVAPQIAGTLDTLPSRAARRSKKATRCMHSSTPRNRPPSISKGASRPRGGALADLGKARGNRSLTQLAAQRDQAGAALEIARLNVERRPESRSRRRR